MDLSKPQKKIAREIIETGLQNEYSKGLTMAEEIIKAWNNKETNNRDSYLALYKHIETVDKNVARRYNDIRPSDYIWIIVAQLNDGYISEVEIEKLPQVMKDAVNLILKLHSGN